MHTFDELHLTICCDIYYLVILLYFWTVCASEMYNITYLVRCWIPSADIRDVVLISCI